MDRFIFLGTGADVPTPERETVSVLVEQKDNRFLLECPPSVLKQLRILANNVLWFKEDPIFSIQRIFLSHLHWGHCLGIPYLLYTYTSEKRTTPLWIYGPTGTKHFVKTIMKLVTTLPKELETYPYEINIVELPRKFFTIKVNDELLITTAPLKHVKLDLGIRLDFVKENRSLIYTGDTSPCKNAVRLSNDGSILIADCNFEDTPETSRYSILRGHCTSRQAAKIALDANVKSLYLTHLHGTRYGVKDIATKIIAEASEVFHGNVYYPDDLDSFSITTGLKNESMSHNCSETSINRDRG